MSKVKTTGWVAFGFAKQDPNAMRGYDVAIGGVTTGGTAYINVRLRQKKAFQNITFPTL